MKKASLLVAVIAVGMLAVPGRAQDAAKKAAPKPAVGASQAVLDQWNEVGRKLIAMAEDFPEDKYDFKPTPAQQGFAQRLLHVAQVNYFFTNVTLGQKPPAMELSLIHI